MKTVDTKIFESLLLEHILEVKGKKYISLRESDNIEFKQTLHIKGQVVAKEYLMPISGLANNKGGYLIFGIHPNTHEIVGIKHELEDLDNRYFSTVLREGLDGSFTYYFHTFWVSDEKLIGGLIVEKATIKPVILRTNIEIEGRTHPVGDIYFRYPAQTARITADDLRALINQEVANQVQRLLKQVHKLLEIGPDHAAVLNMISGNAETEVDGHVVKLVMTPDALEQINIIREGKFVENEGAPAYIVKGEIELENIEYIEREKEVARFQSFSQIWVCFLQNQETDPLRFLQEVICQSTPFYPVFFLIRKSGKNEAEIIEYLSNINVAGVKAHTRKGIINRLQNGWTHKEVSSILQLPELKLNTENDIEMQLKEAFTQYKIKGGANRIKSVARTVIYQILQIQQEIPDELLVSYFIECAQALLHQTIAEIQAHQYYYLSQLQRLHDTLDFDNPDSNKQSFFKKVICYYDYALFSKLTS